MVKQLRISTHFLRLPCADLILEELAYIISNLNNVGISDKDLKKFELSIIVCKIY